MSDGSVMVWRKSARMHLPAHAPLRAWLHARGSLTAHLTRCFGPIEVQRLHQGPGRARADEAHALGLQVGQRVWVREVVLRCQGQALVMARSVCEHRHMLGAWRALNGLGSRPLAELLFNDPRVHRQPLSFAKLSQHQRRGQAALTASVRATSQPGLASGCAQKGSMWQRRSAFSRLGARLLVSEMFLPQVQAKAPNAKFFPVDGSNST